MHLPQTLVFKLVPPNGSEPTWQTTMLHSDIVPLIYVNETICMVICPSTRFKSIVFMARDESSGAKIIPKYILWIGGLVPFWVLRHSFLSLTDGGARLASIYGIAQIRTRLKWLSSSSSSSDYITSSWRIAGGYSFCPLLMPMSEAFSISFIL